MHDPADDTRPERSRAETGDDALASLGQVTGELLHDIAGMVGILSSRAALVREDARVGHPVTEEVNRLSRDCDYLKDMVSDVLEELGGRQRSPEVAFVVRSTLQVVVDRWLAGAPSVTARLSSSASADVQVAGAESFFARAVTNLLQNASRHARSEIRLSIDEELRNGRRGVLVAVEDDGEGVDVALRARMFDPLTRGSVGGGTGLGLSFGQWAVRKLGGDLRLAEAAELGGARFEIWLPSCPTGSALRGTRSTRALEGTGAPAPAAAEPRSSGGILSGTRVLVVDDEPMIRRVYRRLLERIGAEVEEVFPRPGARTVTLAAAVAAARADVILLDLNLDGLSGLEVWELLAEHHPVCARRVLFLSGDVWSGETPDPDLPPRVSKLVEWDELVEQISKVLAAEKGSRSTT